MEFLRAGFSETSIPSSTSSGAAVLRIFRDLVMQNEHLVRGVVLNAGKGFPLNPGILALPWGWMVAAE